MIRFEAFTKQFGRERAVDALSLAVAPGEVVALLGPNGSGKTTSLKAAAGLIRPTSGSVRIGDPGRPAFEAAARESVSFLPQKVAFPESLTGREVVEFYRRLRGVDASRTAEVLGIAALNGASARRVGTYSGGMVQRLGLAVATLPPAPWLLLDEPTAALDPEGLVAFHELVERRKRAGQAVVFTSHQLGDVDRLADRFAVLVKGRLVATLSQRELGERLAARGTLRLAVDGPADLGSRLAASLPAATWDGRRLVVAGAAAGRPAVIDAVRAAGGTVTELTTEEGRLDLLYRELVRQAGEAC